MSQVTSPESLRERKKVINGKWREIRVNSVQILPRDSMDTTFAYQGYFIAN